MNPPPIPNSGPPVWPEAIALAESAGYLHLIGEMRGRDRLGRQRYGTPLCRGNGRDFLMDLREELLDAYVYAVGADRRVVALRILDLLSDITPITVSPEAYAMMEASADTDGANPALADALRKYS